MILAPKFDRDLTALLERRSGFDPLGGLIDALDPAPIEIPLGQIAIVFDTSAILRLPSLGKSDDIVDYLRTKHTGPVVVPGQVVQEFWNNHGNFIRTAAANLRQKVQDLKGAVEGLGSDVSEFAGKLDSVMDEFELAYGNVYEEGIARKTRTVLGALREKAIVSFANRDRFYRFADQRQKTKTPPGFQDAGDGDFFIWLDALSGLHSARSKRQRFSGVALVSFDKKKDWLSNGIPHPLLASEIKALFGAKFMVWDLNRLVTEVTEAL